LSFLGPVLVGFTVKDLWVGVKLGWVGSQVKVLTLSPCLWKTTVGLEFNT